MSEFNLHIRFEIEDDHNPVDSDVLIADLITTFQNRLIELGHTNVVAIDDGGPR
jgi:hypothetical protein